MHICVEKQTEKTLLITRRYTLEKHVLKCFYKNVTNGFLGKHVKYTIFKVFKHVISTYKRNLHSIAQKKFVTYIFYVLCTTWVIPQYLNYFICVSIIYSSDTKGSMMDSISFFISKFFSKLLRLEHYGEVPLLFLFCFIQRDSLIKLLDNLTLLRVSIRLSTGKLYLLKKYIFILTHLL